LYAFDLCGLSLLQLRVICFVSVYLLTFRYSFFFFFSSRRRHTRSKRDWSSDVCSSDLTFTSVYIIAWFSDLSTTQQSAGWSFCRSEERRVGKECRSRWATYHEKKKKARKRVKRRHDKHDEETSRREGTHEERGKRRGVT